MYDYLIQRYQNRDINKGLFLFGITIQNHGGYTYPHLKSTVPLNYKKRYPEAEQFLTLANMSDTALEEMIAYFKEVNEPVVICFFGDHQPRVETDFLEDVHGSSFDDLDNEMLKYKIPFIIWANYDIEEQNGIETSINYLSTYLLEVCDLELPAYNLFLRDAEQTIPVVTANGYYSNNMHGFLPISEASGEEEDVLNQYNILEYSNMFDKENETPMFQIVK